MTNILQDSFGDVNHKLDHMVGNKEHGQLIQVGRVNYALGQALGNTGIGFTADISWRLAKEGRIFAAADADQNDAVTGQTSFANTTPTFMLSNPATAVGGSPVVCIPFYYQLNQMGSVAGGDIAVDTEIVFPDAYASSGTSEKVRKLRIAMQGLQPANKCLLRSTPTATAGYGLSLGHATLAPDVSPAEGMINVYEWRAPVGLMLDPGSSLNVFTYAASTGPTWGWTFVWAEVPIEWLN